MTAGTIRATMFPTGATVSTKLSQIPSGTLFRHYDNEVNRYVWTSDDGDVFTDVELQGLLVERGEVPVVMRYR